MMTQRTIDRYTIVKAVGRGGQGEVFHVRDQAGSEYALKWLLPHMVDRGSSDRLIREFHSIYRLDHPGVVRVHELGQWDNRPFYTMEWIDGDHLDAFIQSEHSLDVYYDILIQAFEALAYIHDHRLIHRDIKPSNIMITTDGQVKLMDFGLVKNLDASIQLTQAHKILGTLTFVSPEHLCGEPIDHRSDLYSMGIVIYRVFSRKLPFFAESLAGIVSQHLSSTPPRLIELVPSIPRDLSDLVAQLLKKAPWERPSSARFVADSLRTISRQTYRPTREITASDTHVHYRLQPRFSGRKPERDRLIKDLTANERFSIQIISGQHGIGKTRLLTESLKESLVQGLSRVIIRSNVGRHLADSGQKSLFHQIAGQIERHLTVLDDFRGLLPELAPLHPAFSQFEATRNETTQRFDPSSRKFTVRYLSAVVGHLTRIQPWLIIWDDLQTADAFQLEFIRDLIEFSQYQDVRCTIWVSVCEDDFVTSAEYSRFISMLSRASDHDCIRLKSLSPAESARMVASLINHPDDATAVERIVQLCQGIPSVIVQTIANWIEHGDLIPSGETLRFSHRTSSHETLQSFQLEDLIRQQVSRLTDTARELLLWITVLDEDAYLAVLRYILHVPEHQLMILINDLLFKNLLICQTGTDGERYSLTSPVLKHVLIQSTDPETMRNIHLDAVGILEDLGRPYAEPHRIAAHQEQGGEPVAALKNYYQAAREAWDSLQVYRAREFIDPALHLLSRLPHPTSKRSILLHARILVLGHTIYRHVGNLDQRQLVIDSMIDLLPDMTERNLILEMYSGIIHFFIIRYRFDDAQTYLERFEAIEDRDACQLESTILELKGFYSFYRQEFDRARDYWKKTLLIRQTNNEPMINQISIVTLIAKTYTITNEAEKSADILHSALRQISNMTALSQKAYILSELGNVEIYRTNFDYARKLLTKAHEMHRTMGSEYQRGCNLHDIGLSYYLQSDLSRAKSYVQQAFDLLLALRFPRETFMGSMSLIFILNRQGYYEEAMAIYRTVSDVFTDATCIAQNPMLVAQHYRVLAKTEDRATTRARLRTLIRSMRNADNKLDSRELNTLVTTQLISENRFTAADRLLTRLGTPPDSILTDWHPILQLCVLRIHTDPEKDHTALLSHELIRYMKSRPSQTDELTALESILIMLAPDADALPPETIMKEISQLITRCQDLGAQWWLWSITGYLARRNHSTLLDRKAQEAVDSIRHLIADRLAEPARSRFLARPVLSRI